MIVLDVVCRARVHDSAYARRVHRCVCPPPPGYPPPRVSRSRGYVAPRAIVRAPDPANVERAVSGDRSVVLSAVERDEAIDRLDGLGYTLLQVALQLEISLMTVSRRRRARRSEERQGIT